MVRWLQSEVMLLKQTVSTGNSIEQISKLLNRTYDSVEHKIARLGLDYQVVINLGHKNPNWKGKDAGYFAIHKWVMKRVPKQTYCSKCEMANQKLELHNISGLYKRDISDWIYLCRRCHMEEDGRITNRDKNGKFCEKVLING